MIEKKSFVQLGVILCKKIQATAVTDLSINNKHPYKHNLLTT